MNADVDFFSTLYRDNEDPWDVRQRWYERRKRALLLAVLPAARFARVFEPACGNGELTAALAARSDTVIAGDFSAEAVAAARRRLAGLDNVALAVQTVPHQWPAGERAGPYDLIVLSEFLYYLPHADIAILARCAAQSLSTDGCLVACHWRPDFPQRTASSEAIHTRLGGEPGLHPLMHHEETDFVLDVWSRDARSIIAREHHA
ncbi:MAG: class I SAM-dependent methyltransferase [Rhodocyclaceae bacterium]